MIKKLLNLFGSVQLVVPLLIVITLVSVVGVVIPQGASPMEAHEAGWRVALIVHLGLNHLFSTWWFYGLLGLLSVNVVACSASHQVASVRRAMRPHFLKREADAKLLKCSTEFTAAQTPDKIEQILSGFFKRRLFFVGTQSHDGGQQISSRSFCIKEIGSLLFHGSILFFFAGGIVGSLQGFSFVKEFHKGEVATVKDWNHRIRCDWFKIEKNDEGAISDYKSKLTVLSGDSTPLLSKVIEVNHPLSFDGLSFYQNSYGEQSDAIEEAGLSVSGPGLDSTGLSGVFPFNAATQLPGSTLSVVISRYVCDFIIDANGEGSSRSSKPNNPAVKVALLKGSDTLCNNWCFQNFPEVHQDQGKGYKITFLNYTPSYFTGIKISGNPGNILIWLGFALMTVGILLVFYFPHKNYWIFIGPGATGGTSRVVIGGSSGRALSAFQDEFTRTGALLQSLLKKGA